MMVIPKYTRSAGHLGGSAAVSPIHSGRGRNADQEFDDALNHGIHRPADVAGDAADHHAKQEADGDAEQPHRQRHAPGVQHPREHVAAELIGAEQVQRGGRQHPEQVQVGANEAEQLVRVGAHEEVDAVRVATILGVEALQRLRVAGAHERVDETAP